MFQSHQIIARQLSPGRLPALGVLVLLMGVALPVSPAFAQQQSGPVPVTVAEVVRREIATGQSFVGSVEPLRRSTVGSAVDERVVEFSVNEGDRVEKGQVLAKLRTKQLEIMLAGAKAELDALKSELDELRNPARPEEIEQGEARLAAAQALMEYTRAKRMRTINLIGTRSVSPEELDDTKSKAEQADNAYKEAKAGLELLKKGARPEKIAQAEARVHVQQEAINRIEDQLEEHTITAPFDGYVVSEHTEVGQWVSKGQPIVEMVEMDSVDVTVMVLEDYVRFVKVGDEVVTEFDALPDEPFAGKVVSIVPQADLRSRSFPVKVRVPNHAEGGSVALKSGMLARINLPVGPTEQALLVPKDALVLGGNSPTVYVIDPDPKNPKQGLVRPVPVRIGVASGGLIQVDGALKPGETVVVEGNERLRPGQAVAPTHTVAVADPSAARNVKSPGTR